MKSRITAWATIVFLFAFGNLNLALTDETHSPIGEGVNDLPIFDAHVHYKEPAWERYPVESVIELMDRNNVAMGLVSSTPDEGTVMLWEYAPNRIVPELRPYHGEAGASNWTKIDGMEDYLQRRLEQYPHEGIGEFHIYVLDTSDEPLFRKIIEMAKARDISPCAFGARAYPMVVSPRSGCKDHLGARGSRRTCKRCLCIAQRISRALCGYVTTGIFYSQPERQSRSGMESDRNRVSGPADDRQRYLGKRPVGQLFRNHRIPSIVVVETPPRRR